MRIIPGLARLALAAALMLILAPAHAQPQPGAPLSLSPPQDKAKKHTARPRTLVRRSVRRTKAAPPSDVVMRAEPGVALISKLPWWASDEKTAARIREEGSRSQVLTAADTWLQSSATGAYAAASLSQLIRAEDESPVLVEPSDLSALESVAGTPADRSSWLYGFLALLAGAIAAAATARLLFARRTVVLTPEAEV
jgi:hypothetical protein